MEETNGDAQHQGGVSTVPVMVSPVETAPESNPAPSLDPSVIGRRVEQEVSAFLEAAQAEADRIRSKALAGVKMAEAKVAALQQQVASTLAQLGELAQRIEPSAPVAPADPTVPKGSMEGLAERFARRGALVARNEPIARNGDAGVAEPTTDPVAEAAASVFEAPAERAAPTIPPSDEIVRLLREHLT
jgi:hypothetical protein